MKKIAGPLVLTMPCPSECGNSVKREFGSRSRLTDYQRDLRRSARGSFVSHLACDECRRKVEAEREAELARISRRDAELRSMPWEDYVETKEWIEVRNNLMHSAGYRCERCYDGNVGLYVYLGEETQQGYPDFSHAPFGYYVLCASCVPSYDDLLNPGKGEYVKREFIPRIMDWNQGHRHEGLWS